MGELGPDSKTWRDWQKGFGSDAGDVLMGFDPSLEKMEPIERGTREYLLAAARAILLGSNDAEALTQVNWEPGWTHPDWGALDRWACEQRHSLIDDGLRRAGWFDASDVGRADVDVPGLLQEGLLDSVGRKRGGEFYTPEWLADRLVDEVWLSGGCWLDPTSGGGALARAVGRKARQRGEAMPRFVGLDSSPFGVLATAAAIGLSQRAAGRSEAIGVGWCDILHAGGVPSKGRFDRLVGNPPWVLWDSYPLAEREGMAALWDQYGLRLEKGMASILGGGKRDVAYLVLLLSIDRWLKMEGRSAFVVPQSLFKSTASGRGLRQWRQPDGTPLRVDLVEDMSRLRPFPSASVKAALFYLTKGLTTTYPVAYRVWRRIDGTKIDSAWACPSDPEDPLSHWRHDAARLPAGQSLPLDPKEGSPPEERDDGSIWGASAYQARLGVNVGGASGVYWMTRLDRVDDEIWRMANLFDRGRRVVDSLAVDLESWLLYPILLGRDLRRWKAVPSAWILLLQDPAARRGWSLETLSRLAPKSLAYVERFEGMLRDRAAFKRFFQRTRRDGTKVEVGPYYSMFNVSGTTLSPIKVVWNRMGRRLSAAVVQEAEGKPIFPQETHCFVPAQTVAEADYLAALLNSRSVVDGLEQMHVVSSKSLATPRVIHSLAISRFDPDDPLHVELAALGEEAREVVGRGETLSSAWEKAYLGRTLSYWRKNGSG
jgi:hypothetical protein